MIVSDGQHEVIHTILDRMLTGVSGHLGYLFLYDGNQELGISAADGRFLRAHMQSEGLVTNADGPNQNNLSELTPKGFSIARSPGGYRSYIRQQAEQQERQQKREDEQFELNRQGVAATVGSTRMAKVSTWIAGFSLLVTLAATYIAYRASAEFDKVNARLQKLETQVQQFERAQPATASGQK